MKIELLDRPFHTIRGEDAIIIFPTRPYWFSATKDILVVLEIIEKTNESDLARKQISEILGLNDADAAELLEELCSMLYTNKVLSIDGLVESNPDAYPQTQLNPAENVLVIAATQACNLRCGHCHASAGHHLTDEMTTKQILKVVDDLDQMPWKNTISRIGFTGGEFFLRPDATQLIQYASDRGFQILISSNGLLLTESIINFLKTIPNLKLSISLDGSHASMHELVRGEGTFDRTIATFRTLCLAGIHVGANMFVHQGNLQDIENTLKLAQSLGVRAFNCLNVMQIGRAKTAVGKQLFRAVPEYLLYRQLFSILRTNPSLQSMMENSHFANQLMGVLAGVKSHYCGVGTNRALYIKADGNVYPCPDMALPLFKLGNIKHTSLRTIWESSSLLSELRQLNVDSMNPTCHACPVRYYCGGSCRGENYQTTQDLRSPHFRCEQIKQAVFELMWIATEDPTFYQSKVDKLYAAIPT